MELSEEEKKAIKIIEETHDMLVNPKLREEKYTTDDFEKAFYVVIMLIRKQQKEIEEKSTIIMAGAEKVKQLEKEIEEMREELQMYVDVQNNDIHNYISKDKIREKIEELKEIADEDNPDVYIKIDAYQELLEEN